MSELDACFAAYANPAPYGAGTKTDLGAKQKRTPTRSVRFCLAQREGFEPSCGVIHKLISSQPRYDLFDTSAY